MRTLVTAALLACAACAAGRAAPPTVQDRLPVGDSFLHHESAGAGRPLVFLHGGQMDSRMWDDTFAAFARSTRVVRYDVRGYGRSGPVAAPYASHEDLHALLEALELDGVVLVGSSLGGRIAIDYALDHPERVAGLVLAAPGVTGWDWSGPDHAFFEPIAAAAAASDTERAVELWLASPYMSPAMERADLAPRLRELARANERAWTLPPVEHRREPPAVSELARLHVPTLLLIGGRDVPDLLRIADHLETELPRMRRVDLPDVGHLPSLEARAVFEAELQRFLRDLGP